jgi:RNA polymerase sigma-70 factor (ECF subfamily)
MRLVSAAVPRVDVAGSAEADGREVDRILLAGARTGDHAQFRAIFDRHGPSVRRFLRDLFREADAADEAMQETFVRAHAGLCTLREDAKLLPWLLGIARHVFHETLRRRKRPQPEAPAPPDTPETMLIDRQFDHAFAGAVRRLPDDRRAAFLLRVEHGLDYDEIRGVLGWSLAKVKNEIHRARLQLRDELEEHLGGRK